MLAKKSLGQNFLINKSKIKKIINSLDLKKGDIVIEIGPGHGELTEEIRNEKLDIRVIAVEKDRVLAKNLKEKFKNDKNIEIIEGDALKILPDLITNYQLPITNYKIVGNIPYYITGYLFRIIGGLDNKPSVVVFTIQKEVAQRICADGRTPRQAQGKMNLLSASVQFWAEPKIIDIIPKGNFRPIPKVDSAVIKLTINNLRPTTQQANKYYKFIKILFKQPRKTILNNVESGIMNYELRINKEEITVRIKNLGINPLDRPQDLNIEQIIALSTLF